MAVNAYQYALNLLSARAYTTRNLRRKMIQKEFDPTDADAAIERLIANGLMDDVKYAAEYARQKLVAGGSSVRRVEQELGKRGIGREIARKAATEVMEEEGIDASIAVERAGRKKVASLVGLDPLVRRRRLFGFLARRGFDIDDINRAMARILVSEGDPD